MRQHKPAGPWSRLCGSVLALILVSFYTSGRKKNYRRRGMSGNIWSEFSGNSVLWLNKWKEFKQTKRKLNKDWKPNEGKKFWAKAKCVQLKKFFLKKTNFVEWNILKRKKARVVQMFQRNLNGSFGSYWESQCWKVKGSWWGRIQTCEVYRWHLSRSLDACQRSCVLKWWLERLPEPVLDSFCPFW